jgi:hypothetical protein
MASMSASPLLSPVIEELDVDITALFSNGLQLQSHDAFNTFVLAVEAIGSHVAHPVREIAQAVSSRSDARDRS